MSDNEIINLINIKELEIRKLQYELESLKRELNKPSINKNELSLSREEKIKIFMSYFKGRDDVYPYLSIDKNNPNIKYYISACANEWEKGVCNKTMGKKCKNCRYRENKPLSKEVIYKHMYENNPIGIYPLLENDTCYFLSLDFDNKNTNNDIKSDDFSITLIDKYIKDFKYDILAKNVLLDFINKREYNKIKEYKPCLKYEIADVFIYLLAICNSYNIALLEAFKGKERINLDRIWESKES